MKKKQLTVKITCPMCLGTGKIHRRISTAKGMNYSIAFKRKAVKLVAQGYSLRAVAKKLGLNHPQSVQSLVRSFKNMIQQGLINK